MLKKFFAVMFLSIGIIFSSQFTTIENVYAENSRKVYPTGAWDTSYQFAKWVCRECGWVINYEGSRAEDVMSPSLRHVKYRENCGGGGRFSLHNWRLHTKLIYVHDVITKKWILWIEEHYD